jgi:hypothetical protein
VLADSSLLLATQPTAAGSSSPTKKDNLKGFLLLKYFLSSPFLTPDLKKNRLIFAFPCAG